MLSNPTMTITKYQFSGLLNQASTALSTGFHWCGALPFNSSASYCGPIVARTDPGVGPDTTPNEHSQTSANNKQPRYESEVTIGSQWPAEKIAYCECRNEECYNLPNVELLKWLNETHPDTDFFIVKCVFFSGLFF